MLQRKIFVLISHLKSLKTVIPNSISIQTVFNYKKCIVNLPT